jgi:PIN domain nuclease of toxin-antitoxin system
VALDASPHGAVLLDTNTLIWWDDGDPKKLGGRSRRMINGAISRGALWVSAVTFWEAARLAMDGKITLRKNALQWREELLASGLREIPLDGAIALHTLALREFHSDPFDLFIVASAIAKRARLITSDKIILGWRMKRLATQSARE